jgi:hypothetical protein
MVGARQRGHALLSNKRLLFALPRPQAKQIAAPDQRQGQAGGEKAAVNSCGIARLPGPYPRRFHIWICCAWPAAPDKNKKPRFCKRGFFFCALTEIRTPVLSLKGLRPGPLDDEGERLGFYHWPARWSRSVKEAL